MLVALSRVYVKMNRYEDALLCNKNLVSYHQSESRSLADVFHSMGKIFTKLSKYDESIEYLNKSLSIHRASRDPNQISVASILLDLANANELSSNLELAYDNLVEVSACIYLYFN